MCKMRAALVWIAHYDRSSITPRYKVYQGLCIDHGNMHHPMPT